MKIRFSDNKRIFNEHTEGIPYVSFDMLDRMGVPNLYSTRFISWDDVSGRGVEGIRTAIMKKDDMAEAAPVCRANRDLLAYLQKIGEGAVNSPLQTADSD